MARVLIVDDEKDTADLVTFLLERDGHQVTQAYDGKEGLDCALRELPDLIILDIMMPEMDGYALSSGLLSHAAAKKIPIIVLTAKGGLQATSEQAPNVRFHLEKPFDPQELRNYVATILKSPEH